ncbi:MAG: hypothetical protein AAB768_03455 [Patescibacteria group bacterium]
MAAEWKTVFLRESPEGKKYFTLVKVEKKKKVKKVKKDLNVIEPDPTNAGIFRSQPTGDKE